MAFAPEPPGASEPGDAVAQDPGTDNAPINCTQEGCDASWIRINEVVSSQDGLWIDEVGDADDYIELVNVGPIPISLEGFTIADDPDEDEPHMLIGLSIPSGGYLVLHADDEVEQGLAHLPFRLSSDGEEVVLWAPSGEVVDQVEFGQGDRNTSFSRFPNADGAFEWCIYGSPGRANGASCGPPDPPPLPGEVAFTEVTWPSGWPGPPQPMSISELLLKPATFIELANTGDAAINLADVRLTLASHLPGSPWPDETAGQEIAVPSSWLNVGDVIEVPVDDAALGELASDPFFEGVATLWGIDGTAIDRVDFMHWPDGAALARDPESGALRFCQTATPGAENAECRPLAERRIGDRVRNLYTPGDFEALSVGGTTLGIQSVKFVVEWGHEGVVHILAAQRWDLHYTFIREQIHHHPRLDRCLADERAAFRVAWGEWSRQEYLCGDTNPPPDRDCDDDEREFQLGTYVHHGGAGLWTIEFATGDHASSSQMRATYELAARSTYDPTRWALRPQGLQQVRRAQESDGMIPIVSPSAPYQGVTFQPMNEGEAYGILQFVPSDELGRVPLGYQVIVVTDEVPNDMPLLGGLITEGFQTPLAHVNVLSRNRGTPNMALRGARDHADLAGLWNQLVHVEVTSAGWSIEAADPLLAEAFWADLMDRGDPLIPRLDASVTGLVDLEDVDLSALPSIGAKAAQMAELLRVRWTRTGFCGPRSDVLVPHAPFAIPVSYYLAHFDASGAEALMAEHEANPEFRTQPEVREAALAEVRLAILSHPVDEALMALVTEAIESRYEPGTRVRFRSSSNTEDLPGFNGAGLYTSISGALGDPERPVEGAIRTVWASLWSSRAYDERAFFNVDESQVAMGILCHPAFLQEDANGVAITRSLFDPTRGDMYFFNAQIGEASVVNPAAGVTTEQVLYRWWREPRLVYYGTSSLTGGEDVLNLDQMHQLACVTRDIHNHFQPRIDPDGENSFFAMDIEWKFIDGWHLVVKQARPYSFGEVEAPGDCREY